MDGGDTYSCFYYSRMHYSHVHILHTRTLKMEGCPPLDDYFLKSVTFKVAVESAAIEASLS